MDDLKNYSGSQPIFGETLFLAPSSNRPNLDGSIDESEWAASARWGFRTIDDNQVLGTIYFMHDTTNLYVAVRVQDEFVSQGVEVFFENDHDGLMEVGDDVLRFTENFTDAHISKIEMNDSTPYDPKVEYSRDVRTQGNGSKTYDGKFNNYELSHPLCSDDRAQDFCISIGKTVGFKIRYLHSDLVSEWPVTSNNWSREGRAWADLFISDATQPIDPHDVSITGVYDLEFRDDVYRIEYNITNGDITWLAGFMGGQQRTFFIRIDPDNFGSLQLALPEELVDPIDRNGTLDITVDGREVPYDELKRNPEVRILEMHFEPGYTHTFEIRGLGLRSPEYGRGTIPISVADRQFNLATHSEGSIGQAYFTEDEKKISFAVRGLKTVQTCHSITIPTELLGGEISVLLDGEPIHANSPDKPDYCDPSPTGFRKDKFEGGFYERIIDLVKRGETRSYGIIILVGDPNKDKLVEILERDHNASSVAKASILSFVTASVPITELPEIADYDFIGLIGDGEKQIGPESNSMSQGVYDTYPSYSANSGGFKINKTENSTAITFGLVFPNGSRTIDIIGTTAIPEFALPSIFIFATLGLILVVYSLVRHNFPRGLAVSNKSLLTGYTHCHWT